MRIKKIAALVMAGSLSVCALTGCSQESKNYFNEVEKTASWDGVDTKVDGAVVLNVAGQDLKFDFKGDGYINQADLKGKLNISLNSNNEEIKIPSIEMYLDNAVSYINKDYFTGAFTNNGLEVPSGIANIPAQYIGIDNGMDKNYYKMLSTQTGLLDFQKDLLGDTQLEIPMTQKDREYTVNLNEEQISDLIKDIVNGVGSNLDKLNTTFNIGLDADKVKEIQTQLQSDMVKTQLNGIKDLIKGSTVTVVYKFEDDSLTSNINVDIKVKDMGSINITANGVNTKAEKKDVEIPLGRVKFTQKQYIDTMTQGLVEQAAEEK